MTQRRGRLFGTFPDGETDDGTVAEQRAKEACDVIDLLFKPGADGKQPQL